MRNVERENVDGNSDRWKERKGSYGVATESYLGLGQVFGSGCVKFYVPRAIVTIKIRNG